MVGVNGYDDVLAVYEKLNRFYNKSKFIIEKSNKAFYKQGRYGYYEIRRGNCILMSSLFIGEDESVCEVIR